MHLWRHVARAVKDPHLEDAREKSLGLNKDPSFCDYGIKKRPLPFQTQTDMLIPKKKHSSIF